MTSDWFRFKSCWELTIFVSKRHWKAAFVSEFFVHCLKKVSWIVKIRRNQNRIKENVDVKRNRSLKHRIQKCLSVIYLRQSTLFWAANFKIDHINKKMLNTNIKSFLLRQIIFRKIVRYLYRFHRLQSRFDWNQRFVFDDWNLNLK